MVCMCHTRAHVHTCVTHVLTPFVSQQRDMGSTPTRLTQYHAWCRPCVHVHMSKMLYMCIYTLQVRCDRCEIHITELDSYF